MKRPILPQIPLIYADKTQNCNNNINLKQSVFPLRYNVACYIRLRPLRNLRENNTQEDLINQQETK